MRLRVQPPRDQPFERDCAAAAVVIVGRSGEADLTVNDASMSRRHAKLFLDAGHWFVEDLGARNGTSVNGRRIDGPTRLRSGDVLRLGDTALTIDARDQQQPPAAAAHATIFRSAAAIAAAATPPTRDAASLERHAERLKLLNDFQRALAAPISLEALLDRLLERLFDVLTAEEGVVLLKRRDGTLHNAAVRRAPGARGDLVVSRRLVDEVIEKGAAALVSDAALDDRFSAAQSILGAGIRSIVAAPLADPHGCLGMVALYSRIHVRQFSDEDLDLLVSLASAAALRVRNVGLAEEAAARRAIERELAVAHEIQMGMLPARMPDLPGLELAAQLRPARAVGGDLYDFFALDGNLWFIVGDVAGKGVGAALFMAVAKTLFRALAPSAGSPGELMTAVNRELARDNDRQVFVTAFAARFSVATRVLEFCNAGHNLPFLLAPDGSARTLRADSGGPVLGIFEEMVYGPDREVLPAGSGLLIYTDGVTDARDVKGEQFSDARLETSVQRYASAPATEIVASILSEVTTFAAGAPQEDDITLLALRSVA